MTALRIAMLTTFFPPHSFGGDAIGVQRLATALSRRGHKVTVLHDADAYHSLARRAPPAIARTEDMEIVSLRSPLPLLSNFATHQTGRPVVHGARIRRLLEDGDFDVIWYHNISLIGGPELLSYGRALKIYEAHEHWLVCPTHVLWRYNRETCDKRACLRCVLSHKRPPQLWRYTGMLDRNLDHVDVFIAKSEFSRKKHEEFGFSRRMDVVPYFLPDRPQSGDPGLPSPHDRPYFLFVGRLEKIKGLDDVIPAFRTYRDADLIVIGEGDHGPALRRLADGADNVKFLGRKKPEDLHRYYNHALALIVPSVCFETFGIILIESFQNATPVIARRIGPFPEIIDQSGGGILFSSKEDLVCAMQRLQGDPTMRRQYAQSARTAFETYWSEEVVVARYMDILRGAALANGQFAFNRNESAASL